MNKQFTLQLQEWMNTPATERNYHQGALFLLQLTNNKILYNNIKRTPEAHAEFIEFKIKRYLQFRLQDLTHTQVQDMQQKVDKIVKDHGLEKPSTTRTAAVADERFRQGKRQDHDTLPDEIQAAYVENADIMRKMRELHMQLRNLSVQGSTCPDSDRYPFLAEIIKLDTQYHKNWLTYDTYTAQSPVASADTAGASTSQMAPQSSSVAPLALEEASRLAQQNILRQINLTKGRYKKTPSEALKQQLDALYSQLAAPSDKLTTELKQLGIL